MTKKTMKNSLKIKNIVNNSAEIQEQVCMIRSTAELQQLLRETQQENTGIYAYRKMKSAGIKLDFSLMNHIIEIDCDNLVAVVEPGVKLADLSQELSKKGLRFIPADPVYYQHHTVGEWAYQGCPNVLTSKYGSGKFFLMGADFVLPTGELLTTGGKTVKNVTGYDFTRFFLGAYADLGVGVRFLLKLLPMPKKRVRFKAEFVLVSQVLAVIENLRKLPGVPVYILWADAVACGFNRQSTISNHQVVCEFDGVDEEVTQVSNTVKKCFSLCGASEVRELGEEEEIEGFTQLFNEGRGFTLTDEYKIPYSRQAEFIDKAYELFDEENVAAGLFGQPSEGKVHIYFTQLGMKEQDIVVALIRLAEQVGGVSSGKYQRLYTDRKLGWLEQNVKDRFDPQQRLNR